MTRKVLYFLVLTQLTSLPTVALADDSAASIAAGGLVARREARVTMAKEVLEISPTKVVVEYEFRNDTDEDVETEVAFPVPPYETGPTGPAVQLASFADFKLTIDGKATAYQREAKAFFKGKDVSAILTGDKIDIASYGHLDEDKMETPDFMRLPKAEQKRLIRLGLFDEDYPWGQWEVRLQFHWRQRFPAHGSVRIRHEYTPVEGFDMMHAETFRRALAPTGKKLDREEAREQKLLHSFCPEPGLLRGIVKRVEALPAEEWKGANPHWVDFILTTANTWRRPIEDFTLIVDRGSSKDRQMLISFCSPRQGKVERLDANRFEVQLRDFVPEEELRIGWFDLPLGKSAATEPKR